MFISPQEILQGREVEYPLSPELRSNLDKLLVAVNKLRAYYGKPLFVSSGYRPGKYNVKAGGSSKSSHLSCEAVDFHDVSRELTKFLISRLDVLEDCGLYMESPDATPTWVHVQIRPTVNRIFKP